MLDAVIIFIELPINYLPLKKCFRGVRIRGEMFDGTKRSTSRGKPLCQLLGVGAFSEYAVLPEIAVAKVCVPGFATLV